MTLVEILYGIGGLIIGSYLTYIFNIKKLIFKKLHEKRADVVDKLFKLFVVMGKDFESLMSPIQYGGEPCQEDKKEIASESFLKAKDFFDKNKIYLERNISGRLNIFFGKFHYHLNEFIYKDEEGGDQLKSRYSCADFIKKDVPVIIFELENNFKRIIGLSFIGNTTFRIIYKVKYILLIKAPKISGLLRIKL